MDADDGNPRSRTILLRVAYDGTGFNGWQIQPGGRTVQGVLRDALSEMEGRPEDRPVKIRGAGRTDAGVHALDQAAAFETSSTIPCGGYRKGLNSLLPPDVAVRQALEVPESFDPRYWTCIKVYRYAIHNSETRDPFLGRYASHVRAPLDTDAMQEAAHVLVGTHDFGGFRATDCERRDPVRTIRRLDVTRRQRCVFIEVEGHAFLKYMVRVIAGTLIEVGRGKMTADDVSRILRSADRTRAGPTAPARGLTLVTVTYPDLADPGAETDDRGGPDNALDVLSALPSAHPGTRPCPDE